VNKRPPKYGIGRGAAKPNRDRQCSINHRPPRLFAIAEARIVSPDNAGLP
jgi:hypothetical protein